MASFPNVPVAPGVPPVLRAAETVADNAILLAADAAILAHAFQGPQWGIFDQANRPVITGDTVLGVDFRKEWRVSDYPIEEGGFASYNKVRTPFDIRVRFAYSGKGSILSAITSGGVLGQIAAGRNPSLANRTAFLQSLDAAAGSLSLFNVVTPEFTYAGCNIVHYDYRREARHGATMLIVDVWLNEIRVAPSPQFSNTKQPSGADPVNGGTVLPRVPGTFEAAAAVSAT